MLTIGEFSRITGLTVKTLRFYHDRGLLVPAWIDKQTGYRHYNAAQVERARIITQLRSLEFPLEQIGKILANCGDEADILDYLERQRQLLEEKLQQYRDIVRSLATIIQNEREVRMAMKDATYEVQEKTHGCKDAEAAPLDRSMLCAPPPIPAFLLEQPRNRFAQENDVSVGRLPAKVTRT